MDITYRLHMFNMILEYETIVRCYSIGGSACLGGLRVACPIRILHID